MHEIQKFLLPKDFFWRIMKMTFTKYNANKSQGPPKLGFRSVKVENWDKKKDSQDFKKSFQYGIPKLYLPTLSAQAQKFGISMKKGFIEHS